MDEKAGIVSTVKSLSPCFSAASRPVADEKSFVALLVIFHVLIFEAPKFNDSKFLSFKMIY